MDGGISQVAYVTGSQQLIAHLSAMPSDVHAGLVRTVTKLALQLERLVKQKLSGPVLKVRSGLLRSSIHSRVQDTIGGVIATVGTNVKYARIHEFGGTIHIPEIRPKSARALAFEIGGQTIFAAFTRAHDVRMPERSFLRSALREMEPQIKADLSSAVGQAVQSINLRR